VVVAFAISEVGSRCVQAEYSQTDQQTDFDFIHD
jgi:5-carboxymethyl-2-hydroxymuconate isomerase